MIKSMRKLALLMMLAIVPVFSFAHTGLKESTPAADATVSAAPESIQLVFTGPVRLVRLQLMGEGHEMPTAFEPSSEPVATFNVATPGMHPGKFTVTWAAIGADGHTLTDSYQFTVDPASAGSAP